MPEAREGSEEAWMPGRKMTCFCLPVIYLPKCTAFFHLHLEVKVLLSYSIRVSHSEFRTAGVKVRRSVESKLCWDQVQYFLACSGNKQPLTSAGLLLQTPLVNVQSQEITQSFACY